MNPSPPLAPQPARREARPLPQNPLEQWYDDIPPLTKWYTIATAFVALAIQFGYLTPFQLYYHPDLILYKGQYWRLWSNFLYFGSFGLDFLFHTFFMMRYFRSLEEGSFRGRRSDFLIMIGFGASLLLSVGPMLSLVFLGSPLIFMMVYVWARRNPYVLMSFLGLFTFTAPWLPWVLLGFSLLISNAFPLGDFVGIVVGHIYYFLEDVYPNTPSLASRRRILAAPHFLKAWLGELPPAETHFDSARVERGEREEPNEEERAPPPPPFALSEEAENA